MLKGIPALLTPDLLRALAAMGHGDRLAIVDRNYPSETHGARIFHLQGVGTTTTVRSILELLPVDDYDEPAVVRMVPDGRPDAAYESHAEFSAAVHDAEGREIDVAPVERKQFYELSRAAVAIVQTGETRPYSCFLITKGVV